MPVEAVAALKGLVDLIRERASAAHAAAELRVVELPACVSRIADSTVTG
jgi:hypothetical protein